MSKSNRQPGDGRARRCLSAGTPRTDDTTPPLTLTTCGPYLFKAERWPAFTRFLDDGRVCLTNNAAERALRGVALGRKSWLFAGSERGGDRAAFMYSLIVAAKMNDVDPQAWLADVLARLPYTMASRVPDLLPWNWSRTPQRMAA